MGSFVGLPADNDAPKFTSPRIDRALPVEDGDVSAVDGARGVS
jgi:hypothetical protein